MKNLLFKTWPYVLILSVVLQLFHKQITNFLGGKQYFDWVAYFTVVLAFTYLGMAGWTLVTDTHGRKVLKQAGIGIIVIFGLFALLNYFKLI